MEYTLKVTDKEVEVIGAALAELSFKVAAPVLNSLQLQINEQNTPPAEPVQEPAVKSKK